MYATRTFLPEAQLRGGGPRSGGGENGCAIVAARRPSTAARSPSPRFAQGGIYD